MLLKIEAWKSLLCFNYH